MNLYFTTSVSVQFRQLSIIFSTTHLKCYVAKKRIRDAHIGYYDVNLDIIIKLKMLLQQQSQ